MNLKVYLIVAIATYLTNDVKGWQLDEFYNYVEEKIENLQYYQRPENNQKLFDIDDSRIHDYGNFDFIIVGAGAGGSAMASRLSEIESWKILLLEAGGETDAFSDVPLFCVFLQQTDKNWGYLSTPQTTCCQGMVNNQCNFPRGKVIGGSTVLSGSLYVRGSASDYDKWEAMGNTGWSYNDVLPYFKKSEHVFIPRYDTDFHGKHGPVYVNYTYPPSVTEDLFTKANVEKGLKQVDYNGKEHLGVSRLQFNIKNNKHQTSEHAFLDQAKYRHNLKIVLNAAVNKIIVKHHKAEGVTFVKNGKLYKATAKKEVIISAGSINTPQLLMLSGIGPKEHLEKLGIPVINDLPAVGKHLQDHPLFINLYFRTNVSAPNNTLKENLALYLDGKTPLTNGGGLEQLAFFNSDSINSGEAELEFLTFVPPFSVPGDTKYFYNLQNNAIELFDSYNTLTDIGVSIGLMSPKSEGTVTLKSKNIADFPDINLNYFSDPEGKDIETLYKGIKYALSLLDTEAFKRHNATYIGQQPHCEEFKDDEKKYWYCALRHYTMTEYHPTSTTRMGINLNDSVVNNHCVVHNLRNLRVVDAGVMPAIISGHPISVVYMIAEKVADSIKKKYLKIKNCD